MKRLVPFVFSCVLLVLAGCKQDQAAAQKEKTANDPAPAGVVADPTKVAPAGSWGKAGELYPVLKSGKWGFIDNTGKMVIEPKFMMAFRFGDDLAMIINEKKKVGYIDKEGKFAIEPKYEGGGPFSEGLATIYEAGKAGLIDKTGKVVVDPKYKRIGKFHDGLAVVVIESILSTGGAAYDSGYMRPNGQMAIQPQFDANSTSFSEGVAGIRKLGQLWSYIDPQGKVAIKPAYYGVGQFGEGMAGAMGESSRWGFIDKTGKWVLTPRYEQVSYTVQFRIHRNAPSTQHTWREMLPHAGYWYRDSPGGVIWYNQDRDGVSRGNIYNLNSDGTRKNAADPPDLLPVNRMRVVAFPAL